MNARKVKRLRRAAGYRSTGHESTQYQEPVLHHVASMPTYEMHTRVTRSWSPRLRKIVGTEVECIRYQRDGKTPAKLEVNKDGTPRLLIVPVAKPRQLIKDSPRRRYQELKRAA